MTAVLLIALAATGGPDPQRIETYNAIASIERSLATWAGLEQRVLFREDEGVISTPGLAYVEVSLGEIVQTYLVYTTGMLKGDVSHGEGRQNAVGNAASSGIAAGMFDSALSNQFYNESFRVRRNEFKNEVIENLVRFMEQGPAEYDSYSSYIEPRAENEQFERVTVVGYLGGITSCKLTSTVRGDGIVRLQLVPSVLDDVRHEPQVTSQEAYANVLAHLREVEGSPGVLLGPRSWIQESTAVSLTYMDDAFIDRNHFLGQPIGKREAYPFYDVVLYGGKNGAPAELARCKVDAITGQVYGPRHNFILANLPLAQPEHCVTRQGRVDTQMSRAFVPPSTNFSSRIVELLGVGTCSGEVSSDGHYIRLPFGDYYSPKPIPR